MNICIHNAFCCFKEGNLCITLLSEISKQPAMKPDRKSKLVPGYIRIAVSFVDNNMPLDIMNLIDSFTLLTAAWDTSCKSTNIDIDLNQNTITRCGQKNSATVYGKYVIDNTSSIQTWKLKILCCKYIRGYFAKIGIVKNNEEFLRRHENNAH